MSELQLQVGEWYRRKSGRIVGPCVLGGPHDYPFRVGQLHYNANGKWTKVTDTPVDLVEHILRSDPQHPEYVPTAQPQQPATVQASIEVPAPPEGWRVDGWRIVQQGEMYLVNNYWCEWVHIECSGANRLAAVRTTPHLEPPLWLAPGWVAVDDDGSVWWWQEKPQWIGAKWCSTSAENLPVLLDGRLFRDFTPPPIKGKDAIWQIS